MNRSVFNTALKDARKAWSAAVLLLLVPLTLAAGMASAHHSTAAAAAAAASVPSPSPSPAPDTVTVTDMAGRTVSVTQPVTRLATIGPVPVLNSLVFALGAGDALINGLPDFARHPRWALQYVFAPHTRDLPTMQNPDHSPRLEALLRTRPDLVLTMNRQTADLVQAAGLPAVHLAWRNPQEVKRSVAMLSELLGRPEQAARFSQHFDDTIAWVRQQLAAHRPVPPRVLYLNPRTLSQPHAVAEWWIAAAGGASVSEDGRSSESRPLSMEQILAWDPQVLVVGTRQDRRTLLADARFATVAAIRNQRIAVAPTGAHTWGNRTAEQALTVLWAATVFHPQIFPQAVLLERTRAFYRDVYEVDLTAQQLAALLSGGFEETVFP